MTVTSNSAVVTLTTANMVAANSFNVVGTAFQTSNDAMVAMDTRTYPENIVFRGLEPSTSYRYTIQIVSTADDSIVIGSYSGTFTTSPPSGELYNRCPHRLYSGITAVMPGHDLIFPC